MLNTTVRRFRNPALSIALALAGCTIVPPPAPPDVPGATCETWCAHAAELGGCGLEADRCLQDCRDADKAERSIGRRQPLGCLTAARSCDEAMRCK